jgi:hypothetical protein
MNTLQNIKYIIKYNISLIQLDYFNSLEYRIFLIKINIESETNQRK